MIDDVFGYQKPCECDVLRKEVYELRGKLYEAIMILTKVTVSLKKHVPEMLINKYADRAENWLLKNRDLIR
jgi:hypothetical protein